MESPKLVPPARNIYPTKGWWIMPLMLASAAYICWASGIGLPATILLAVAAAWMIATNFRRNIIGNKILVILSDESGISYHHYRKEDPDKLRLSLTNKQFACVVNVLWGTFEPIYRIPQKDELRHQSAFATIQRIWPQESGTSLLIKNNRGEQYNVSLFTIKTTLNSDMVAFFYTLSSPEAALAHLMVATAQAYKSREFEAQLSQAHFLAGLYKELRSRPATESIATLKVLYTIMNEINKIADKLQLHGAELDKVIEAAGLDPKILFILAFEKDRIGEHLTEMICIEGIIEHQKRRDLPN